MNPKKIPSETAYVVVLYTLLTNMRFESSVILEGYKTKITLTKTIIQFESSVILEGYKTMVS